ncbi:MAG: flagellar biosynthesis protein FlhF [Deltaproteobacteria bacterium]|nr:flagellar biosynthesis protein FlhF [Deltaproteobacteria bacterium]MBW2307925.1 flagellar biosynthesis protein FlhF [Deltaproteobacteria bacterium]
MKEAIDQVKEDLGPNAIILSTRNINEGGRAFGLFGRKLVEVTAALDRDLVAGRKDTAGKSPDTKEPSGIEGALKQLTDEIEYLREKLQESVGSLRTHDHGIEEIRYLARYLESQLAPNSKFPVGPEWISLYQRLRDQEVEDRYAISIIKKLQKITSVDNDSVRLFPRQACLDLLGRLIKVSGPLKVVDGRPKVVALVGPTGVGKTTTIAKLAAHYALIEKKRVAMVTLDTYRIGAAEQLKIYAQIIDSPIEVVFVPERLRVVLEKLASYHLILIDTAGRSQNNGEQIEELKKLLNQETTIETHLVLSATTKNSDLNAITSKFGTVGFDRLIFTKLDESYSFGCILNEVLKTTKPLSYITFGQRVPEDIDVAHGYLMGELVLGLGSLEGKYPNLRG